MNHLKHLICVVAFLAVSVPVHAATVYKNSNPDSTVIDISSLGGRDFTINFGAATDTTYNLPFLAQNITFGFPTDSVFVSPIGRTQKISSDRGSGYTSSTKYPYANPFAGERRCLYEERGMGVTTPKYYTWSYQCDDGLTGYRVRGAGGGSGSIKVSVNKPMATR